MILLILLVIFLLLLFIVLISQRKFDYWKKRNVKYLKPVPILGNYGDYILQKKTVGEVTGEICEKYQDEPLVGAFYGTEPVLIVQDPEIIKLVTTKEFYYFNSREISAHTAREPITQNMFFNYGDKWKVIRQNLTPIFSSAKMKNMFPLIRQCSYVFEDLLDRETKMSKDIDVRCLMSRFTMDCITVCAFGMDAKVMTDTEANPFKTIGETIFDSSFLRGLFTNLRAVWPSFFYGVGLQLFPNKINDFFSQVVMKIMKERQETVSNKQDFVDLILKFKENAYIIGDSMKSYGEGGEKIKMKVDDNFLLSQCILFFAAGYETSSSTASFTLYELAKHPEIQEKVLEEVDAYIASKDGELAYDCVTNLPYLEQCVNEALRFYPVLPVLTREVTEPYKLPNGLLLEKGIRIHLPLYYLHRSPKFFPDPEVYNPDRFSPENKNNITPYSYFPFGEGPRICIGMRFARMQMYAGLITLLKKYRVELAPGMPKKVKLQSTSMVTQSVGGLRLRLIPREGWESRVFKRI